ncbi:MAG TPA: hypothetical protein VMD03_07920 [Steroidobacteraceae bacterium]|nr:hypothetical protein [Steroidobacteraceae bacterium]
MSRLSDEAPPGVNLSGAWQLDPQLSTDSRQVLQHLVQKRKGRPPPDADEIGAGSDTGEGPDEQGPPGGGRGYGPRVSQGGVNDLPVDITLQLSMLRGGDFLRIEQRPSELVVSNGDTTRTFVPGERSVVSVPSGVADQRSGWKGKQYWIQIRPQVGPSVTEKLRLSDKGDQLIETIDITGEGRVRPLHVTRVYTPARGIPAPPLPLEN